MARHLDPLGDLLIGSPKHAVTPTRHPRSGTRGHRWLKPTAANLRRAGRLRWSAPLLFHPLKTRSICDGAVNFACDRTRCRGTCRHPAQECRSGRDGQTPATDARRDRAARPPTRGRLRLSSGDHNRSQQGALKDHFAFGTALHGLSFYTMRCGLDHVQDQHAGIFRAITKGEPEVARTAMATQGTAAGGRYLG